MLLQNNRMRTTITRTILFHFQNKQRIKIEKLNVVTILKEKYSNFAPSSMMGYCELNRQNISNKAFTY